MILFLPPILIFLFLSLSLSVSLIPIHKHHPMSLTENLLSLSIFHDLNNNVDIHNIAFPVLYVLISIILLPYILLLFR